MTEQTASRAMSLPAKIRAGWRGEASLSWVFWNFHFGGGLLLFAVGCFFFLFLLPFTVQEGRSVLASPVFRAYAAIWLALYLAYVVSSAVMVWRCSSNVSQRAFGYIARVLIVLWLMRLLLLLRALLVG